jgi:hypothetical protein
MARSRFPDDINVLKHSGLVATAAYKIASLSNGVIDPQLAHTYGLFHDVGKLFIKDKNKRYMHPLVGYRKMMAVKDKDIARICITHPFPVPDMHEYIECYCKNDSKTASSIKEILNRVSTDIYVELIQICDKMAGLGKYTTIEEKYSYYAKHYKTIGADITQQNYDAWLRIKRKIEEIIGADIYEVLQI